MTPNVGKDNMYDTNAAGGYFNDMRPSYTTTYNIEDDAAIFVYNYNLNSYSVVKGSDLENVDPADINWAFTVLLLRLPTALPRWIWAMLA